MNTSTETFDLNHETWKTIHESDFLEFVPVEEMEKVDTYLREHEVEPYFDQY